MHVPRGVASNHHTNGANKHEKSRQSAHDKQINDLLSEIDDLKALNGELLYELDAYDNAGDASLSREIHDFHDRQHDERGWAICDHPLCRAALPWEGR